MIGEKRNDSRQSYCEAGFGCRTVDFDCRVGGTTWSQCPCIYEVYDGLLWNPKEKSCIGDCQARIAQTFKKFRYSFIRPLCVFVQAGFRPYKAGHCSR